MDYQSEFETSQSCFPSQYWCEKTFINSVFFASGYSYGHKWSKGEIVSSAEENMTREERILQARDNEINYCKRNLERNIYDYDYYEMYKNRIHRLSSVGGWENHVQRSIKHQVERFKKLGEKGKVEFNKKGDMIWRIYPITDNSLIMNTPQDITQPWFDAVIKVFALALDEEEFITSNKDREFILKGLDYLKYPR